jgi:hypothetical protein
MLRKGRQITDDFGQHPTLGSFGRAWSVSAHKSIICSLSMTYRDIRI